MDSIDPVADRSRRISRILVVAALAALGLWIAAGFLPALAWAVVIAIAIDPLHLRLRRAVVPGRHHALIAAAITTIVALIVLVPLTAGITQAAGEAHEVAAWIARAQAQGVAAPDWIAQLPVGRAEATRWWQANLSTPEGAAQQLQVLHGVASLTNTRLIGSDVLKRLVTFAFTLLALFFILRDRDGIVAQCGRAADRALGPTGDRIGRQAIRSVRGTIDGLVLVGIGEGAVMIVVYAILGVPHPILLGALTAVAAMIPFGAILVFTVAAVLLLGQGSAIGGIAVITIGLIVVGIADHFIRPALIGGATRLPFLWVLIGILGGVEALGLLGLFVGPATMAVLVMLWRDYLERPVPGAVEVDASSL